MIVRLVLIITCASVLAQQGSGSTAPVRPGIEVFLSDVPSQIRGKRIGLITNHAGIDRAGASDIDLIAARSDLKLVALFAAEHGIRGSAAAGEKVADDRDEKSGVPIFSLYRAEDRGPSPEMLKDVDALIYDLPEVGGRTWTYVSTMALAMQSATRKGIPFVVLDRPNPIGGDIVEGALLDPAFKSFVGMYPIPARHAMTVGELAGFFNTQFGIGVDLIVARAGNWRRSQWFADTGLPWRNPSPNLRSPAALNNYPGTVYFEGTNLTEGRGTQSPFQLIGASWLTDAGAIVAALKVKKIPGVVFDSSMQQVDSGYKFGGEKIPMIRIVVTDRDLVKPQQVGLLLMREIYKRHTADFKWRVEHMDRLFGSPRLRAAVEKEGGVEELLQVMERESAAFAETTKPYWLYQ